MTTGRQPTSHSRMLSAASASEASARMVSTGTVMYSETAVAGSESSRSQRQRMPTRFPESRT